MQVLESHGLLPMTTCNPFAMWHNFLPSRVFALRHLAASLEAYVFPGNLWRVVLTTFTSANEPADACKIQFPSQSGWGDRMQANAITYSQLPRRQQAVRMQWQCVSKMWRLGEGTRCTKRCSKAMHDPVQRSVKRKHLVLNSVKTCSTNESSHRGLQQLLLVECTACPMNKVL